MFFNFAQCHLSDMVTNYDEKYSNVSFIDESGTSINLKLSFEQLETLYKCFKDTLVENSEREFILNT